MYKGGETACGAGGDCVTPPQDEKEEKNGNFLPAETRKKRGNRGKGIKIEFIKRVFMQLTTYDGEEYIGFRPYCKGQLASDCAGSRRTMSRSGD